MNRQIPFRIVGLYVESFNLTDICLKEDIPVEVRTNYEFGVIPEDHMVMARLTYAYLQEEAELLQITLVSTFDVNQKSFKPCYRATHLPSNHSFLNTFPLSM